MYTLTRGPVPDKVAFTIRVDSCQHPELATFLHNLPFGIRTSVVAELLALGLAAKQAGATLVPGPSSTPASAAAPAVRRRSRKPAVQPVLSAPAPPTAAPAAPVVAPPALVQEAPTAHVDPAAPTTQSLVSQLLDQFDD